MTDKKDKPKLGWVHIAALVALLVFTYGVIHAVVGTPKTSKLAEKNEIKIAVMKQCIINMTKQLDRIEEKLDKYAETNGYRKTK